MSNSDISRQMLEMPALGRTFDLGMVYDAVWDKPIPGFTYWNRSDLKNVKIAREARTKFSIIASDKLADKFEELIVDGSLQVSILSGMIKLSGSANYLDKKKSTSRKSSVLVKFQYITAVKKLTMEQLDDSNLRYPQIQKTGRIGSATHIVTQIQYGAEATFTFTKKLSETEDEQEVNGQLQLGVEKFKKILEGNPNVGGSWADANEENENNIECHFQGDFKLPSDVGRPTTYKEAIEFAKKFLQFSSDWMDKDPANGNQSLGVPLTVWLYPLVLMQDAQGAPALRYEISLTLASQCVRIMENYEKVEDDHRFMLEDPLVKMLGPLQRKLQLFQRCLTSFIAELKIKLGEMVVGIRSGKIKVKDFGQLMTRISNEQFPFHSYRLERWLDQKDKELCLIKRIQAEIKNKVENQSKVHFFPSARTLQQQMTRFPVDFGFEISLSSLARSEPFLELLNQTLISTNYFNGISIPTNNLDLDPWYENSSVIERIQKEVDIFVELVNTKSNNKTFAFAIAAPDECNEICATQFSIIVHNKQARIFGWDAALNVCQHYPKEKIIDVFWLLIEHFEERKFIDVIRLLVEEKIPEKWNPIPLLALCRYYDKENLIDIVRLLIEKNIDVNCKTDNGDNALTLLCQFYKKEDLIGIVRLLIEKNIDVNCKDNSGWNALLSLFQYYDKDNLNDIVRLLIKKNFDVNCKNNDGWNALHFLATDPNSSFSFCAMSCDIGLSRKLVLKRPALGRPFNLGTLYNAQTDETIPGFTLWSENDLKDVNTTRNKNKSFSLIGSDKLTEKFQELDASDSIQLNVLLGMVEPKGSAVYLVRKKRHFRETSIYVRCHYLSAVKEFTTEQLDEKKIRFLDIARSGNQGTATHVVTKIQYGADATFTLTKRFERDEDEHKASDELNKCAAKLIEALKGSTIVAVDGSLSGTNDVDCHFETDFNLPDGVNTPTTYHQAIEFTRTFKQFAYDCMAEDDPTQLLGVPVTVWLHPLVPMPGCDGMKPAPLYEMSLTLASQCVQILENYEIAGNELSYMLEDPLVGRLSPFLEKLQRVQQHLTASLTELKMKLRESAVNIRSGTAREDSFEQLLSEMDSELRVFNCNRLKRWLGQKHRELCLIKRFQEAKLKNKDQNKVLFFPSAKTLREQMTKVPVEIGFEISFSSLARPECFPEWLNQRITEEKRNDLNGELWCENKTLFERIQKEVDIFVELVNGKSNDEKFAFAMTAPDEYNKTCATQFSIIVHHKQERIFGWDAVIKVCQLYPKERIVDVFRLVFEHFERRKFIDVLRLFVEEEIPDEWNPFPFLALCRYYKNENLIDIVRMLIEKNVDVNCKNNSGDNALTLLCEFYKKENLIDIIRLLIEKNIDVNCKVNGWNALLNVCCCYKNDNLIDIVRLLIEKEVDTELPFLATHPLIRRNRHALLLLCEYYKNDNLIDIVRLFIEKNIDVNCKNRAGWNALLLLCQYYNKENLIDIVRLLIEKKIDVNCKNNYECNALHLLCRYYDKENLIDIVRLLIKNNIDARCNSNYGWTALLLLCQNYQKDNLIHIVRLLLEKNVDVNCMNKGGWNALHYLCDRAPKRGLVDLVRLLIKHNIDKNVKTGSPYRKFVVDLFSSNYVRETPRSLLLKRFKKDEIRDVLEILDS